MSLNRDCTAYIRGKFKKKSSEIGRGQQSDKTEVTNAYKLQRLMFHRDF